MQIKPRLTALEREYVSRAMAEYSLHEFVQQAWHIIEPGKTFADNWHLGLLCRKLEAVTRREIRRLIVNVPPRSSKSTIISVMWPVWSWLQDPSHQWLTLSHSAMFASRDALKSRRIIESPWFQERWGLRVNLAHDQNQKTRYENNRSGYRVAMGITSGITGEGGDTIILDDVQSRDSAHSIAETEAVLSTYDEAVATRLNNPATGAIVIVMQRLHVNDLTAHVLKGAEKWDHVCLPMLYEKDHPHRCPDDIRTVEGEPLWPTRYTPQVMAEWTSRLGSYAVAGQLQQRPVPVSGGMLKLSRVPRYTFSNGCFTAPGVVRWMDNLVRYNVADLAYSAKQTADYTVIMHFAACPITGHVFVTGMFRQRIDILAGENAGAHRHYITAERARSGASYTLVEAKALAIGVIELLQRQGEPISGIRTAPGEDKVARAHAAIPWMEQGLVLLPHDAPWLPPLMEEAHIFPTSGAHDDTVDCLVYGINHWRSRMMSTNSPLDTLALSMEEF